MLVACPECEHQVSDRARACPGCGFPIAEHVQHLAEQDARARDRATREACGEVDCRRCDARGFHTVADNAFAWCRICEHTGRLTLVRSGRGYFAVARLHVEAFVAGARDEGDEHVVFLGSDPPPPHRYPEAGARVIDDD